MRFTIFYALIVCSFLPFYSSGQQIISTSAETDWQLNPVMSGSGPSAERYFAKTLKGAILAFDKKGTVVPLQSEKNTFGIALLDQQGNIKWHSVTKGNVIGLAKFGENVICFYSPEWNAYYERKPMHTIYAGIYDVKNGKLIQEKAVVVNNTEFYIDPKVLMISDQQFSQLLIRYTAYNKGIVILPSEDKAEATEKLSVFTLSSSLEPTEYVLSSLALKGKFLACQSLSSREWVISTKTENEITIEKFNINSIATPEKYPMQIDARNKRRGDAMLVYSPEQSGVLYESLRYENENKDRVIALCKIDLASKKTTIERIVMNKSLAEGMENDPEARKGKIRRDMRYMDLMDIAVLKDKVILMMQARFSEFNQTTHHYRYHNDQLMLMSFDLDFKKLHSVVVDRKFVMLLELGEKAAWKVYGDQMHLLYNVNKGLASIATEYTVIDLKTFTISQQILTEKDDLRRDATIEPEAVVWAENSALIPYTNSSGYKNGRTVFQQIALKK